MKTSIVIPLFNEIGHISKVIKGLEPFGFSIVIVDDGSRDSSSKTFVKSKVVLLTHKVNLGKGAAMKTGAEYAFSNGSDSVIFMDSDGQHNPKDIKGFLEKLKTNKYGVIFGSRNLNKGMPFVRHFGNRIASMVISFFFGIYVSDPLCGFRAITKEAYKKVKWDSVGYGVESEMVANVAKNKLKFIEIPVKTIYHDKDKGVTILDAFGVLLDVLKWRLSS